MTVEWHNTQIGKFAVSFLNFEVQNKPPAAGGLRVEEPLYLDWMKGRVNLTHSSVEGWGVVGGVGAFGWGVKVSLIF